MYLVDKYSSKYRDNLVVTFITAPSNAGKTTSVKLVLAQVISLEHNVIIAD